MAKHAGGPPIAITRPPDEADKSASLGAASAAYVMPLGAKW